MWEVPKKVEKTSGESRGYHKTCQHQDVSTVSHFRPLVTQGPLWVTPLDRMFFSFFGLVALWGVFWVWWALFGWSRGVVLVVLGRSSVCYATLKGVPWPNGSAAGFCVFQPLSGS